MKKWRWRPATQYIHETMGLTMPTGQIDGEWFLKNDLPMVVECRLCGSTMLLPSAMVDDDGYTYCTHCVDC